MMFSTITPNRAVLFVVFTPILYFILTLFVGVPMLRNLFNSLALGTAVVITGTYFLSFLEALRQNAATRPWKMIIAISVLWMTVLMQRIYAAVYNYYGRPDSWDDSAFSGYWPYSFFVAGLMFLAASTEEKIGLLPSLLPLLIAVAIGSGLMGVAIGLGITAL